MAMSMKKKIGLDPTNQSPKVTMENQAVRFSVDSNPADILDEEILTVAKETSNIQGIEQIDVFESDSNKDSHDDNYDNDIPQTETMADNMARDSPTPSQQPMARHALSPSPTPSLNTEPETMDLTPPSPNGASANLKETLNKDEYAQFSFVPPPLSLKQEVMEMNGRFMNELTEQMASFQDKLTTQMASFQNDISNILLAKEETLNNKFNTINTVLTEVKNSQAQTNSNLESIDTRTNFKLDTINNELNEVKNSQAQTNLNIDASNSEIAILQQKVRDMEEQLRIAREAPPPPPPPSLSAPGTGPQPSIPEMERIKQFIKLEDRSYFETTLKITGYHDPGVGSEIARAIRILREINSEYLIDQVKKVSIRNGSLRLTFANKLQFERATHELNYQLSQLNRNPNEPGMETNLPS